MPSLALNDSKEIMLETPHLTVLKIMDDRGFKKLFLSLSVILSRI